MTQENGWLGRVLGNSTQQREKTAKFLLFIVPSQQIMPKAEHSGMMNACTLFRNTELNTKRVSLKS